MPEGRIPMRCQGHRYRCSLHKETRLLASLEEKVLFCRGYREMVSYSFMQEARFWKKS